MKRERNQDVDTLFNGEKVTLTSEEKMNEFRGKEGPLPRKASLNIGLLQGEEKDD